MEKLRSLYESLVDALNNAPDEDDCSYEEIDMYADMQNLKESMEKCLENN